eukprot:6776913-Ditylum_brightwellii.AAC.1
MRRSPYEWDSAPSSGGAPPLEEDIDDNSDEDYGISRDPRRGGGRGGLGAPRSLPPGIGSARRSTPGGGASPLDPYEQDRRTSADPLYEDEYGFDFPAAREDIVGRGEGDDEDGINAAQSSGAGGLMMKM